ncbi:hypothetical protein EIP91_008732 [Steccherinum ochraceum]|uniref:SET domain-containing protein n=1 Tax=Steccherinum ochraceum TaxID=92696 RepID=A0A4R0RK88_9APHY|nr:hypothetical protein EIP91_008732 [Steccherinum ochraceum]
MDPIPVTMRSMMDHNSPLFERRILTPEIAQHMLSEPTFRTRLERIQEAEQYLARNGPIPSWHENLVWEGMKALKVARKDHEREQTLPPARANEPSREEQLAGMEFSRAHGSNPERLPVLHHTLLGTQPKFSSRRVEELERVNIRQMMMRKRHTGKYLLCRIISKTTIPLSVDFAIEDPEGNTSHVTLSHYPFTLDASVTETDEIFPIGTILAIREPYYKLAVIADLPIVRVDAPTDLVFVDVQSPLRNVAWSTGSIASTSTTRSLVTADSWKARGNEFFKKKQWFCAAIAFSEGLKLNPTAFLLLLNRAAAYLELQWYTSAARDAEAVLAMDIDSDIHKRKAVFRATKAYYFSGKYAEINRLAEVYPEDSDVKSFYVNAPLRLRSSTKGRYDWHELYRQCKGPAPRPDIAPFQGPVEVKIKRIGYSPVGLFVTRNVSAGDLLLVSRPIASYYPDDKPKGTREVFVTYNYLTNYTGKRASYALIDNVVQRLWDDPRVARTLQSIPGGSRFSAATSYPPPEDSSSTYLSHPHKPPCDIDISRLEGLCALNAFQIDNVRNVYKLRSETKVKDPLDDSLALYELPSFCNHSCVPTASKAFFGDVMVLRATRSLKAGDEVTLSYCDVTLPHEERNAFVERKWGAPCDCVLCKADRADRMDVVALRDLESRRPLPGTIAGLERRVLDLDASYDDTPERRRCGIKPEWFVVYTALGLRYRKEAEERNDNRLREKCAEALMNAIAALGLVIKDRCLTGPAQPASNPSQYPVDVKKPTPFPHMCAPTIVQLATALEAAGQRVRGENWSLVAVWVENQWTGTKDSFLEKHGEVIHHFELA